MLLVRPPGSNLGAPTKLGAAAIRQSPSALDSRGTRCYFPAPSKGRNLPKPELGTKHECAECGTKFYDMGKPAPVCPKCGTNQVEHAKARAKAAAAAEAAVLAEMEDDEDEDPVVDLVDDDDDDEDGLIDDEDDVIPEDEDEDD